MNSQSTDTYQSSINPFINEYQAIVEGLLTRQENLKDEFASLIEDIEKLSKKSHVEELTKITRLLSSTQQNLEEAGTLLETIESRVSGIEKKLGFEDDSNLYSICFKQTTIWYINQL